MNQKDYDKKVEEMINEGIAQGKYEKTENFERIRIFPVIS